MKAIIRTQIATEPRLALLEGTILSARAAGIQGITIVDDQSPLMVEVRLLCYKHGCTYLLTNGAPGPCNALYWSLKIDTEDALHLCDSVALATTNWLDLPDPCDWGVISYFSPLDRKPMDGWWKHPTQDLTLALACRFHPEVKEGYLSAWDKVRKGVAQLSNTPALLLRLVLGSTGTHVWNTGWDFAQQTELGAQRSKYFIAERR